MTGGYSNRYANWKQEDLSRGNWLSKPVGPDHIEHAASVAGPGAVGLGSDFDGGGTLLESAADFPRITAGLVERGFGEEELAGILGGNHLRLLSAVIR